MKSTIFLAIVLVSGFSAGIIHGLTNFFTVEPFLDEAIWIENQNLFASGQEEDTPVFWAEFDAYRDWQKGGQVLAGGILGLSVGALFGIVFAYSRHVLPSQNHVKKSLVLAGLMWFTIFMIPFLKYPANPPTVGDPETVVFRAVLYLSFVALSGLGALGFYKIFKKLEKNKRALAFLGYGVYIAIVFVLMPANPDEITAPMDLVNGFRVMSVIGVTVFWAANALILGFLWQKFQPHKAILKKV